MNNLEKYIRENKSRFDEEPQAGHFERLQEKVNRKSGRIAALSWGVSIAASIAIVLTVGIIVQQQTGKQKNETFICENVGNMKSCYLKKMNVVAGQIETLSKNLDEWDRLQVMNDVQNIIDTAHSGFESEIPEELPEKQAKAILSDYYRQNLEGLEMIKKDLTPQPPKGGAG